ncbi:hypothetical protein RRG08_040089 [Elysia crispata]|uniref:Uncharacterized protein n=1 Tax=Elysia crispata TaxID=231223 RepID=A0AAE0XWL4_9GAST|nr:hypothetical protein RRG08_040089 [Elysia crispata]
MDQMMPDTGCGEINRDGEEESRDKDILHKEVQLHRGLATVLTFSSKHLLITRSFFSQVTCNLISGCHLGQETESDARTGVDSARLAVTIKSPEWAANILQPCVTELNVLHWYSGRVA